ncbi:MAG TPA: HAMP domain-containing protein, partial [Candidatus Cloacimonadota bacterium]|nr:HAMP domain-containing protein [Candidatus Cloacimonadota bacterium]
MIRFRLSMRIIVIGMFILLYSGSLIILNQFFVEKQKESEKILSKMNISADISKIYVDTAEDSLIVNDISNRLSQSMAGLKMTQNETKIYSSVILLFMMLISILTFIFIFYIITRPIKELQVATEKIKKGDFNVFLPPKGMSEIKSLIHSFNDMSRELESIQQKLLIAQKEMIWKDLARILTHEIKNPLTPIQLSL